jgi:hypothetical protein
MEDYSGCTELVDAALALVERMLPGWKYQLNQNEGCGLIKSGNVLTTQVVWEKANTMPLAILAALLSALIAQRENDAAKNCPTT